jgi:hypothetical protein
MGAQDIVGPWCRYLKNEVFSGLRATLIGALATFSAAMAEARHCASGQVASKARGRAKPASQRRRWERWLAQPAFDAMQAQDRLAQAIWARWSSGRTQLILDETPKANALRCLRVSIAYRRRALPLVSVCYPPDQPPQRMPRLIRTVLDRAIRHAPSHVQIVVLADRGLSWPMLLDWCTQHGCHYLLRLQSSTRVRFGDGRIVTAGDLAPRAGCRPWLGQAQVFKKAGWRCASVVACWPRGGQQPWLLITDESACANRWRQYARRMWIEEAFRDEKSHGFQWQQSRVNDPDHADRLVTILALATLLLLSIGTCLIKRGLRHWFDPRRHRRLSLFQLGLQAVNQLERLLELKVRLVFYFHPS